MAASGADQRVPRGAPSWWLNALFRWRLVALCTGLNLAETAAVMGFDPGARPELAPQASAIAPFGVFGDLRWVSVYNNSWAALAGELMAVLVVRGAITAVSIALAWPAHLPRPSVGKLVRRSLFATALAAVLLSPSVTLLFGLAAVPVSWLFLAAVPAALLVAFIIHPAPVSGDWWQRLVAPGAVGGVALAFLTLSVASAAVDAVPAALWPLVAALGGLFNAWSWVSLVHFVADRRPVRRTVPVAALAALALVGTVVAGTVIGFGQARKAEARSLQARSAALAEPGYGLSVLVVSGYGSSWSGAQAHPVPGSYVEERFSYRGLDPQGMPLPYASPDTAKPLAELDRMLLEQVAALQARTGGPVDVVAESEGALVAKTALLADPGTAVRTLVLASPLQDPGRVWYPTIGDQDWGVATNAAMRLISDVLDGVSPINLSPDNPLFASLDEQAPALENAMACPIAGIRQFALLPLADATVSPAAERLSFPSVVLAAFHGGLIESSSGAKIISQILADRPVDDNRLLALADEAISYAASAWQVPALEPLDFPRTSHGGGYGECSQIASELRSAIFPPVRY
ncbi:MAG: hypothetical protein ABSE77_03400 [Acidimicrobiales bacterium]